MIFAVVALVCATACKEHQMEYYTVAPTINFMGLNNNGIPIDQPSALRAEVQFGNTIPIPDSTNTAILQVHVRLQGRLSDRPLRISLATESDGAAPLATVKPTNPYILEESAWQMILRIPVERPAERHTTYRAKLVFDYADSDVGRGVDELQEYVITVRDALTREDIGITETVWLRDIQPVIGPYSETKARFMVMAMGRRDLGTAFMWGVNANHQNILRTALNNYNTNVSPDNPLRDENGDLVSFFP